jgi:hypothetical protein
MRNYILFDTNVRESLKPFTFTRPVSEIRCGILTITEKWNKRLNAVCSFKTANYLQIKYTQKLTDDNVYINSSIFPTDELVVAVTELPKNTALVNADGWIAVRVEKMEDETVIDSLEKIQFDGKCKRLEHLWNIFQFNPEEINSDFEIVTKGRRSQPLSTTNRVLCPENVFVEEGAKVEFSIINASEGKVYIGKDAEIWENAVIRAPFAMNEHAVVKMSAKIYEGTTIGP